MNRVFHYIEENKMIEAGDHVLVGVSGGADSTCLLYVLKELSFTMPLKLSVIHVHHGIRGKEADRDAAFVEELCRKWKIPFYLEKRNIPDLARTWKVSEESAGRTVRYEIFEQYADKLQADRIAVAHHKDDNAETVLLHLFRGSGLGGLKGILPVSGKIIRPLLCLSRNEIEAMLEKKQIPFCQDSTNESDDYCRNRIRHQILPYVEKNIHQGASENILRAAARIGEADAFLKKMAADCSEKYMIIRRSEVPDSDLQKEILICSSAAEEQPPVLLTYLILLAVEKLSGNTVDFEERHVKMVQELFGKREGKTVDLPGNRTAIRTADGVLLREGNSRQRKEEERKRKSLLTKESRILVLSDMENNGKSSGILKVTDGELHWRILEPDLKKIPENRYTKWFDYDKINFRLEFRHRNTGDYITISQMKQKSLQRFLIDQKLPEKERDALWLVADGDHLLWVIGMRISEYYKVGPETRRVLEMTWSPSDTVLE